MPGDLLVFYGLKGLVFCFFNCTVSGRSPSGLVLDGQEELELRWELLLRVQPIGEVDPPDPAVGVNLNPQGLNVVGSVGPPREVRQVELDLVPPLVETHRHRANERLDPRRGLVVGCSKSTPHVLVVEYLDLEAEVLLQVFDDHDQEWKLDSEGPAKRGLERIGFRFGSAKQVNRMPRGGVVLVWGRNSHGRIRWARDVYRANVGSHDFQNGGLNVSVCDSLDVAVAHCESKVPEVPEDGGERRIEICQFFFCPPPSHATREPHSNALFAPPLTILVPNRQGLAANAVENGQKARLVRVPEHGETSLCKSLASLSTPVVKGQRKVCCVARGCAAFPALSLRSTTQFQLADRLADRLAAPPLLLVLATSREDLKGTGT